MPPHLRTVPAIPKETARAANAIFGSSNSYILIGERLDAILEGIQLEEVNGSKDGAILALLTLFQFMEGLTDVQAIDAVRTRIDWKFALHLSLLPAILHESELCGFRQRILSDPFGQAQFQKLIDRLALFVPSRRQGLQDLTGDEAIAFVCLINCLSHAQQAMNQALAVLAARFSEWLRRTALPHWYGRYNQATPRLEVALLLGQQRFFIEEIGADIHHLLEEIDRSGSPEMNELHEVKVLDQIWSQQLLAGRQLEQVGNHFRLRVSNCPSCLKMM